MTASAALDVGSMQRLSGGLQRMATAQDRNAVLAAATNLAHEVAGADGLCALPPKHSPILFCVRGDPEVVRSVPSDASMQQLVDSASAAEDAVVRHQHAMELDLSAGRRFRAESSVIVPLHLGSHCVAIGFFWRTGFAPAAEQLTMLTTLAWAISFALQAQQTNAELRHSRERQRTQTLELQHRVRNVLALVRSIIRRSRVAGESAEDFSSHLEARVSALARTQGSLSMDAHAGSDLEDLLRAEFAANAVRDTQFSIDGPPLRLSVRATETMALTLHELTINAVKFGALSQSTGHISVDWSIDELAAPARLHWRWRESGVGIALPTPQRRGFGQELIERVLPYELGARTSLTFAPGGARCEIELPVNERTTSSGDADRKYNEERPHDS